MRNNSSAVDNAVNKRPERPVSNLIGNPLGRRGVDEMRPGLVYRCRPGGAHCSVIQLIKGNTGLTCCAAGPPPSAPSTPVSRETVPARQRQHQGAAAVDHLPAKDA